MYVLFVIINVKFILFKYAKRSLYLALNTDQKWQHCDFSCPIWYTDIYKPTRLNRNGVGYSSEFCIAVEKKSTSFHFTCDVLACEYSRLKLPSRPFLAGRCKRGGCIRWLVMYLICPGLDNFFFFHCCTILILISKLDSFLFIKPFSVLWESRLFMLGHLNHGEQW